MSTTAGCTGVLIGLTLALFGNLAAGDHAIERLTTLAIASA